jgi:hypothetical protein
MEVIKGGDLVQKGFNKIVISGLLIKWGLA